MKNKYFQNIQYEKIDTTNLTAESFSEFDILENVNRISYVVISVSFSKNEIEIIEFPLEREGKNSRIIDLKNENEVKNIWNLYRNKSNENSNIVRSFFNFEKHCEENFDISEAKNYKEFDLILDNDSKIWIVNRMNSEENSLELVKFPVEFGSDMAIANIDLYDEFILKLIKKVYR